ncbi:MAG TPA: hypothetical protein ENO03_01625 [Candidatus Aminicenantes bacterium]|nr:hypothetical protein [Candidatus Aminicenantes bacterium]HDT13033.1 hypothetical protein [Candidatus Aminicenantes bacterium]
MNRTNILGTSVVAATIALMAAVAPAAAAQVPPEVRAKAAGIFAALDRIEAEAARAGGRTTAPPAAGPGSRRLVFTEAELNAYAACLLEDRGERYVKSIELKLLAGDRIEGRLGIDLGRPQAGGLMPQKQDLLFAARVESRDGMIRIDMDKLYVGTQAVPPDFVDAVIGVVSRLQGLEPTSIEDWYELPPGVLRLESQPGQVVVIY